MIDLHGQAVRKRIDRWRDAGLIDPATAERLAAFEASARTPFSRTLTIIGAVSIALGVVAVVSANWEALPIWLKLSGHVAVNLVLGAWAFALTGDGDERSSGRDALLIVLSASTLALIAHVGQSFQLQGDEFKPLAVWLALTTPFTLAFGRGAAVRWLWTIGLFATAGFGLVKYIDTLQEARLIAAAVALFIVAGYAAPLAARGRAALEPWGAHLNHVMLGALAVATSVAQMAWRLDNGIGDALATVRAEALTGAAVATVGLVAAGAALARTAPGLLWFRLFVAASPAYAALPFIVGGANSVALAAGGFCLYWLAIAQLSHAAGLAGLYKLAVVVVALRLFAIFIEAYSGLLLTGGGLIITGLLLLGLGYAVRRLFQRTAAAT